MHRAWDRIVKGWNGLQGIQILMIAVTLNTAAGLTIGSTMKADEVNLSAHSAMLWTTDSLQAVCTGSNFSVTVWKFVEQCHLLH